ncbi:hypothetical protein ACFSSC_03060 [Corynebacterium mendelii]|uniref:Cell surface protein n=1 Tax=Corynebacterium mendelii TaxID=2765362 RepID=A0A939IVI0_9CORY|nr:hypothetical protein [Corynebacterium mendelii]MBN9644256.1 hypothetical protein [Corynebacterium mendelii]
MTTHHTTFSGRYKKTAAAVACAATMAAQALSPVAAWADDDHDGGHGMSHCHLVASEQGKEGTADITYVLGDKEQTMNGSVFWHSHIDAENEAKLHINETLPVYKEENNEWANLTVLIEGSKATVTAKKKAKDKELAGFAESNTLAEMNVEGKAPVFKKGETSEFILKNTTPAQDGDGFRISQINISVTPADHCHDHSHDHGDGHDNDHGEGNTETAKGSSGETGGPVIGVLAVLAVLGGLAAAAVGGMIPGISLPLPAVKM